MFVVRNPRVSDHLGAGRKTTESVKIELELRVNWL